MKTAFTTACWVALCALAFAPAKTIAAETAITFRGQTIYHQGAELQWVGDPSDPDAELLLIYKNTSGVNTLRTDLGIEASVLLVGGGGAGGYGTTGTSNPGGGGGGGEVKEMKNVGFSAGTITIAVGAGGAQKTSAGNGENGHPTTVTTSSSMLTALGGGGGGSQANGSGGDAVATGGGGGGNGKTGGVGALGEGSKGGKATAANRSGGGGGSGGAGQDSTAAKAGDGGSGVASDIWLDSEENPRRFGGGGGGGQSSDTEISGAGAGVDGGGTGGRRNNAPVAGTANTGGGGGGGGRCTSTHTSQAFYGAAGGSGIVVIRITFIEQPMNWVAVDVSAGGGNGKIFVDANAETTWVGNDLIITYRNIASRGGLCFKDPKNRPEYADLPPVWANAQVLVVGGGGGGGFINDRSASSRGAGAGGGAGGFVEQAGLVFDNTVEFSIEVGKGGAGGAVNEAAGKSGTSSAIKTNGVGVVDIALGGGGGGAHSAGLGGGSGGGGSSWNDDHGYAEERAGGTGTSGQGFPGGKGISSGTWAGAGGGGASEAGGDSDAQVGGKGGKGRKSNITGSEVWYAGGGGGAVINPLEYSSWYQGGVGGQGGGGSGAGARSEPAGFRPIDPIPATDGVDGLGGGGGGGTTHKDATTPAGKGGNGIVIIRLSNFVVRSIPVPTAQGPFTYDGNAHTGVVEFFAYTFVTNAADRTTWPVAVDADNYVVTVNIAATAPYGWNDVDPSAPNYRGNRTVRWKIQPRAVPIPEKNDEGFVFKTTTVGGATTFIWNAYTPALEDGSCWMLLPGGTTNVHYCTVSGHKRGDAGMYQMNCVLNNHTELSPNVTNFYWSEGVPLTDKKVDWEIVQAENAFTSLTLADWQEGTTNKTPTSTWRWQAAAADYATTGIVDVVKYQWRPKGGNEWTPETPAVWDDSFPPPTEAGVYDLRAFICHDSNHEPGNWENAEEFARFCIWRHPDKVFSDWVDITISSSTGTGNNKPTQIHLKEPTRDSTGAINGGLPGFHYGDVRQNGYELRFVSISNLTSVADCDDDNPYARDVLLPFTVDSWNPNGESLVSVTVPQRYTGRKFRMYWRLRDGKECLEDLLPGETKSGGDASTVCTFGLVSQLQGDGTSRAWVNYWSTEPWSAARSTGLENGRYWRLPTTAPYLNPTTVTNSYFGKLKSPGTVGVSSRIAATYVAMPQQETVVFPTNYGPYAISFTMQDPDSGTADYPGRHVLYDGDRHVDIEIVKDRPEPIDPTGDSDAVNLRVLLVNDDAGSAPENAVSNQSYFVSTWRHDGTAHLPPLVITNGAEVITNNLLPGTEHALTNSQGTVLWKLQYAYLGNLMNADTNSTKTVLSKQKSLPWSATSRNSSTNAAAYFEPLDRRGVGQIVLRNEGEDPDDYAEDVVGACIRSPWYTNGVGTVYFDAVNAFTTNATAAYRLQVEYSTNSYDVLSVSQKSNVVWKVVPRPTVLKFGGTSFSKLASNTDYVELNANRNDTTGIKDFFRVIAKIPDDVCRQPLRFRIRRVSALGESTYRDADDWHGFIVVDNVIASWPTRPARIGTRGWYDETKTGKRVLGWETPFSVAYPAASETNLYAYAKFDGDVSVVTSARCYWRRRYLDSEVPAFQTLYLDPQHGFKSITPFPLDGFTGDLEYYFDLTAVTPFYQYVDYSGCGAARPVLDYTENPEKGVESRLGATEHSLASHGTDWFVRLREGASDLEAVHAYYRHKDERGHDVYGAFDLYPVEDHVWRGFLRTPSTMANRAVDYRFEALSPTAPGSLTPQLATNYWHAVDNLDRADSVPGSPMLGEGTSNDWAKVFCDASTGHLMFQIDDRTKSLTVTHADYQDFNGWSDAVNTNLPPFFAGSSIQNEKKSGASSKTVRLVESFTKWEDTPDTRGEWGEHFSSTRIDVGYPGFQLFESETTENGWKANFAQWVGRFYHPVDTASRDRSLAAVQLDGAMKGHLQLLNPIGSPRGVGEVRYNARVGQPIDFSLFNVAEASDNVPSFTRLTECTLRTHATFDWNSNKDFAGNAMLSMVVFYRKGFGCYEARWEQLKGEWDVNSATFKTGAARNSQRLCLYRWAKDAVSGEIVPKLLGAATNGVFNIPLTSASTGNYMPFFISAKTTGTKDNPTTTVSAGVLRKNDGVASSADPSGNWLCVNYVDTSANHPVSGSYGVLSANCPGVFLRPKVWLGKATVTGAGTTANKFERLDNKAVTFNGTSFECLDDLDDSGLVWPNWEPDGERMAYFKQSGTVWGIRAVSPRALLSLYLTPRGKDEWKLVGTRAVEGFGTNLKAGDEGVFTVRDVANKDIRLQVTSPMADVVLTDVSFTQWRGDNFGDAERDGGNSWAWCGYNDGQGFKSNFVFTSGWIHDKKVRLSARRTQEGSPSSIRSPHFDGQWNDDGTQRGKGLGMIAFGYENAQTNAVVLVQIATNSDARAGRDITGLTQSVREDTGMGGWTTVQRIDFSQKSYPERQKGLEAVYLGLHGVEGLMRIVLDPAVVASVQSNKVSDVTGFGEIDITEIVCRDEPTLESSDWWGWNVRTAPPVANSVRDNLRTYLPDGDYAPSGAGMPIALNNSVTADVREADREDIRHNMPFVQTPTFTNNIVGEVSFRARRYDNGENTQYAEVQLYGANSADATSWVPLHRFIVSNTTYQVYSYKAGGSYSAFRFAVTGVANVTDPGEPRAYDPAVRVLIDEVSVFEAVNPSMGFRYVYPFRDGMDETKACTNVVDAAWNPLPDAQPIAGESWTVQAQVMKKRLPDEIDTASYPPRVIFHWFVGPAGTGAKSPWGYANWRTLTREQGHYQAELAPADDAELVFRGSLPKAREAIVAAIQGGSPAVVQYSADVIFRTTGGLVMTNSLIEKASTTWTRPYWYDPVDYNAGKATPSGYTIIDSIAPGRVWINEVNVYDGKNGYSYPADKDQYIEVAAPQLQSLEGWRIDFIGNDYSTNTLVNFTALRTGAGYAAPLKDLSKVPVQEMNNYRTNNYVFLAVQSPATSEAKTWDAVPAAVDGAWNRKDVYDGTLTVPQVRPIAFRLVRPSNVVEQEIAVEGVNTYTSGVYAALYSATNWMKRIARNVPGGTGRPYYAGNEFPGVATDSLGVVSGTGLTIDDWTNRMTKTPGRVNEGQIIPENFVLMPNGELMVLRAQIGTSGHLVQTLAEKTNVTEEITVLIKKGGPGTNVTYTVGSWNELASVTTNGVPVAGVEGRRGQVTVTVGAGASNDVTVVAETRPMEELRTRYGLDENNRYTAAVLDWLEGGENCFGEKFAHPGEIHLAEFRTPLTYTYVTNLDLTAMYWLDIDPTTNWVLKAGIVNGHHGGVTPVYTDIGGGNVVTNFRMGVHMEITNETSGVAYAPYVLRGEEPGRTTLDYEGNWPSVNFKITGDIQIDNPNRTRWIPVRWFVFKAKPGATSRIGASASFGDDFRATIDVWDPKDPTRAVFTKEWSQYPEANVFYRWALDGRNAPVAIETLRPQSTFGH